MPNQSLICLGSFLISSLAFQVTVEVARHDKSTRAGPDTDGSRALSRGQLVLQIGFIS
jgi:hypothetical protein